MTPPVTTQIPREWVLNANERRHWADRNRRTSWIRQAAFLQATNVLHGLRLTTRQHCKVHVQRGSSRFRDLDNLQPTWKAAVDGIVVDAQLLPGDDHRWLVGPHAFLAEERCAKAYAFTLTFTFEDAA